MSRYTRRPGDGELVCARCDALVDSRIMHDLFHDRIDNLEVTVKALTIEVPLEITATDWQAAHDAGEDEEMVAGERALASETYDRALRDAMETVERVAGERVRPDDDLAVQILAALRLLLSDEESRVTQTEPPVGAVARCFGCGNVYVHRPTGWLNTDRPWRTDSWQDIANSFCGPVKVVYTPEEDK